MNNTQNYTEQARAEIEELRAKVEALMHERVTPALVSVAEQASSAAHAASDSIRGTAHQVTETVRERPLAALGVAALAGFVVATMMRR